MSLLDWFGRHATWILAGGVLVGLVAPPLADLLRPLLVPMILLSFTVGCSGSITALSGAISNGPAGSSSWLAFSCFWRRP